MTIENDDSVSSQQGIRIHLGAGDFLTRYPPGARYRLRVETPVESGETDLPAEARETWPTGGAGGFLQRVSEEAAGI